MNELKVQSGLMRVMGRVGALALGLGISACGSSASADGGDGSGGAGAGAGGSSGGQLGQSGGQPSSGGVGGSGGGRPTSGGSVGTGGSGLASGGAPAGTGGSGLASGGAPAGTGGLPGICSCEAAEVPVCGVDGETYSVGCGEVCVPVDIACSGPCPCDPEAGCGCTSGPSGVCDGALMWECSGQDFDLTEAVDQGCEDTAMSAVRYCCPYTVRAEAFCPD